MKPFQDYNLLFVDFSRYLIFTADLFPRNDTNNSVYAPDLYVNETWAGICVKEGEDFLLDELMVITSLILWYP